MVIAEGFGDATLSETARWLRGLGSLKGTPPSLDLARLPRDPATLFLEWLREAVLAGVEEPHAATLATVGADGLPDARILLVKDVTPTGWAFAGPRASDKAAQLAANPSAALNLWWQPLSRAVRVRGRVVEASPAEIAADLAARPLTRAVASDEWMLWWIRAVRVEFWQGDVSRNHTRIIYESSGGTWTTRVTGGHQAAKESATSHG